MTSPTLDDEWLAALLRLPTLPEQAARVREAELLHEAGLARLLARAVPLARTDPGQARALTHLCATLADEANAPAILPRATYLRAQTHAVNGEFAEALSLIEQARAAYEAVGEPVEALRTNVGLMHVLNELGRHQAALDAGAQVLARLAAPGAPDDEAARLLAAMVHQNRGVCFETIGRYEEALHAYAAAEAGFATLDAQERIGDIQNNRGIVLLHLGRVSEALGAFEQAAQTWGQTGRTLLQAQTWSNIGEAHLLLGHYTRSLDAYDQARRLLDTLDAQAHQHILLRKTADAYLVLNLYPEALAAYREVVARLDEAGMQDHRARALWGMGSVLLAQGRYDEAAGALDGAAALFAAAGNVPMRSSVLLEQAAVQQARGEPGAALVTAQQALALVQGERWPVQHLYAAMRVADLLLPDVAAAEPVLLGAQGLADRLRLPPIGYRFDRRLGTLRWLQGREAEAVASLEAAIAQIEQLRGTLAQEALRTSFLQDKTAAYETLVQIHLARDDVWPAFAVAEQAKSRTLVDLLMGVLAGDAVPADPGAADRLRTLQADLHALYNQFLGGGEAATRDLSLAQLQARAATIERDIRQVQLKHAARARPADALATRPTLDALRTQLPADAVLLAYHIVEDEVLAFVGRGETLRVERALCDVETVQQWLQRLSVQWDRFRAGGAFVERHAATLERSAQRVLAGLYDALVAPLAPHLDALAGGGARLVVVPHGVLHQVPFHALHDGARYLIDRWEIVYAPSVTVAALCQRRARGQGGPALVVGVSDPLIPAVRDEAATVAEQLAAAGVGVVQLAEARATLAAVRTAAPGRDLLHVACHGLFRADNPMFSALKLYDGWLTAAEVMQWDLSGALVTLSACESGRSRVILGDEVIGLPRAFLGAGAATLVVTLWLVQDETTAALMANWYARLGQSEPPARALRAAQLALKATHPHPFYWAPFVLIGRR